MAKRNDLYWSVHGNNYITFKKKLIMIIIGDSLQLSETKNTDNGMSY